METSSFSEILSFYYDRLLRVLCTLDMYYITTDLNASKLDGCEILLS